MVSQAGLEPAAHALKGRCATIALLAHRDKKTRRSTLKNFIIIRKVKSCWLRLYYIQFV